jgi:glycosyltransferase involved in cell wall biosynthesis
MMTSQTLRKIPESVDEMPASGKSICIIAQQQNMSFGGSEVHTLGLMGALIERGYGIELVANRYYGYDDIVREYGWQDRVRIVHTDLGGIHYGERSNRSGWRRILMDMSSEVLIFVKGNNNYGQLGFLRECRRAFKKVVFIEHLEPRERPTKTSRRWLGLFPGMGLWWHRRRLLSKVGSRYADKIVAVSEKVRQRLVTDIGYTPAKLMVILNGVPWRDFARDQERGAASRARWGISSDAFVFGMLTRLSREKGIDTALRALRLLVDQCPERSFCLVVAGEGYQAGELKDLANNLALQDRVKFVGFVSDPEEALSAYDVILFSSTVEGLPLGLLQGMAAGCIPIVTRISGMPEAVNSPEVGWVVAPENPAELCAAMRRVLETDSHTVAQMRQNVTQRIRENFDVEQCHRRLVELCES